MSKVTSDCLVDRLVNWWETVKERFSHIKVLVLNVDNGPENYSLRTQFMQRLPEFVRDWFVAPLFSQKRGCMSHTEVCRSIR